MTITVQETESTTTFSAVEFPSGAVASQEVRPVVVTLSEPDQPSTLWAVLTMRNHDFDEVSTITVDAVQARLLATMLTELADHMETVTPR